MNILKIIKNRATKNNFLKYFQDLSQVYNRSKRALIFFEVYYNEFPVGILNEYRDSFDHLMRSLDPKKILEQEFFEAKNHLNRAAYDCYVDLIMNKIKEAEIILKENFESLKFNSIIGYNNILNKINEYNAKLLSIRQSSSGANKISNLELLAIDVVNFLKSINSIKPFLELQEQNQQISDDVLSKQENVWRFLKFSFKTIRENEELFKFIYPDFRTTIEPELALIQNICKITPDEILFSNAQNIPSNYLETLQGIIHRIYETKSKLTNYNAHKLKNESSKIINSIEKLKSFLTKTPRSIVNDYLPDYYSEHLPKINNLQKLILLLKNDSKLTENDLIQISRNMEQLEQTFNQVEDVKNDIKKSKYKYIRSRFWIWLATIVAIAGLLWNIFCNDYLPAGQ
jgi:hypothetical protein